MMCVKKVNLRRCKVIVIILMILMRRRGMRRARYRIWEVSHCILLDKRKDVGRGTSLGIGRDCCDAFVFFVVLL